MTPVLQDVLVDLGLDPVHGERHQTHAARRVEALDRLHQADIAFLDQVGVRQAVAEVAAGDGNHQAKVRENKLTRRLHIAFAVETLGQPGTLRPRSASDNGSRPGYRHRCYQPTRGWEAKGKVSGFYFPAVFASGCVKIRPSVGLQDRVDWHRL
jgi:hypothetical protein